MPLYVNSNANLPKTSFPDQPGSNSQSSSISRTQNKIAKQAYMIQQPKQQGGNRPRYKASFRS